ncbi:LINE-1 retrotransposable element ORF2 protein [Bienertia sinuspersici]
MLFNVYSGNHLLIGDLNQLESPNQKLGGRKKIPLGRWFKNWTLTHKLSEIPFKGTKYTWSNNKEGRNLIQERLDRAYGNNEWHDSYTDAVVFNFPIFLSDHGPIALDTSPITHKRKRPYRLEAWCYDKSEIMDITINSGTWNTQGSKMFILQRRLERIKINCMIWCLNHKKEAGLNWANFSDKLQETTSLETGKEEGDKTKIRKRIEEEAKEKWDYWRQRAKSKWDDWGDKSTGFFFRSVKSRATKNEIRAIKNEENQWITEDCEIKSTFHNYFKELLRPGSMRGMNEEERRQWFSDIEPISSLHHQNLEAPFSMEETKKAAFSMKPNKTPGLDGIPPGFIQTY